MGFSPEHPDRHEGHYAGVDAAEEVKCGRFLDRIDRPDLKEILRPDTPWAYWTMEIYRDDIRGQGGLGMLASDTLEQAKRLGIPAVFITPFYPKERHQTIEGLEQRTDLKDATPESRGFLNIGGVSIRTIDSGNPVETKLSVYRKKVGSVNLLTVTEPGFGELYQYDNSSDHRLYQEVALGFGGFRALKDLGVKPSMNQQLNEAPTVFSALARLDEEMCGDGESKPSFEEMFARVKEKTIYTNHTLVQAVEARFTIDQFERFVLPNIESDEVKKWIRGKFAGKGGTMQLSTLAIELSGKRNGVSLIHAQEASKTYEDYDGNLVAFDGITNGIALERWGDPELLKLFREHGVLDEFGLPAESFEKKIGALDAKELERVKDAARARMRDALASRKNQYNQPVVIPEGANVFNWKRRIAGYKRPDMIFKNPDRLAKILEDNNAYFVMAGRVHPSDGPMLKAFKERILEVIDRNPVLKQRIHFVQDYDEDLARALAQGADVSLNTPEVIGENGQRKSTEACGTSWEKDILGNTILISTADGGVADPMVRAQKDGTIDFAQPFREIRGANYDEEVESLYKNLEEALKLGEEEKYKELKRQLQAFLPIICGARMETDYLKEGFPPAQH